jgi:3-deoxy-D-manno-octulosonic-acid transferase
MVNARLSEASARSWGWAPEMARHLLGGFGAILCQDTETVTRLDRFGIASRFAGNLKALYDPKPPAPDAADITRAVGARPVWLAASTHVGEEETVLEAHAHIRKQMPDALLILAPRHPERAADVGAIIRDHGTSMVQRSQALPQPDHAVWLADRMGEMDTMYALAPATFVGGSLTPNGGHTPFEPIAHSSAVLTGPHVENFAPSYAALKDAGGALETGDAQTLAASVTSLLSNPEARAKQIEAARETHQDLKPDVTAIARELADLMRPAA